jgi:hypothetical protein
MRLEKWEKQNPTAHERQWVKLSITETFLFAKGVLLKGDYGERNISLPSCLGIYLY